jgi:hypothetical protein
MLPHAPEAIQSLPPDTVYRALIQRIARVQEKHLDAESLLQVLDELASAREQEESTAPHGEPRAEWPFEARLGGDDERLVHELRAGLARLAGSRCEAAESVESVLDSVEFIARCQLLGGRAARIRKLLPSFVYLTLSPGLGGTEARSLATRSAQLLQQG